MVTSGETAALAQQQTQEDTKKSDRTEKKHGQLVFQDPIPNSTKTDPPKSKKISQDSHEEKYRRRKKKPHQDKHRHRHRHLPETNAEDARDRFTTEASIRRVAQDVLKEKEKTWRKQTEHLRESLTDQEKALKRIQRKLKKQQQWWTEVQAKDMQMAKVHKNQEENLLEIRDEVDELQRVQDLQVANLRQMEIVQHDNGVKAEKKRLDSFVDLQEGEKLSKFLSSLNFTNVNDMELIRQDNDNNVTNIFIFPQIESIRGRRWGNSTLSIQQRHQKFVESRYKHKVF